MVSTLLELPTVRMRALPITVAQYQALGELRLIPERVELLEGVIVEKMPKSPLHAFLMLSLLMLLQKAVGSGYHVRMEQPISHGNSEPEPDLSVVRGELRDYTWKHPETAELVIEIALSSAEIDRRKAAIYAAASVREYWIVLPETRRIEIYAEPIGERYSTVRVFENGQIAVSAVIPAFCVELAELFPR